MNIVSLLLAYINIKRLQIDQHRAWMLRAWVYAFIIVSQRLIQMPSQEIVSRMSVFYMPMKCHTIDHILSAVQPNLAQEFADSREAGCGALATRWSFLLSGCSTAQTPFGFRRPHV